LNRRVGGEVSVENMRTSLTIEKPNMGALTDAMADIIITDCKSYYINSRIKLPIEDQISRHAFTCALLAFDHDTDKIIAKTLIKLSPKFNLDSFFDFMLDVLKARWDEVCLLANENISYLVCKQTFAELLQFLISNIDCELDEAIFLTVQDTATRESVKKLFTNTN
jgi:hypothetical protein